MPKLSCRPGKRGADALNDAFEMIVMGMIGIEAA